MVVTAMSRLSYLGTRSYLAPNMDRNTYSNISYHRGISRHCLQETFKCHAISDDERIKIVAHKLLQKEEELKFITAPGRIPPRAAVVAAMRKEISALRKELAEPGSQEGLDLTTSMLPGRKVEASPVVPPSVAQTAAAGGRKVKTASSARNALLMVEKKLKGESSDIPLSDKAMHALEMIEQDLSSVSAASKNLNELETLQVENAILRTKLEVVLEKKRHLTQLCHALQKGYIPETKSPVDAPSAKTVVYTV